MSSEQSNILKRKEQLNLWFDSETDRASNYIKEADKIKFPKEVQFFSACNSNDWSEIERLLQQGVDINCTQDDGLTALHQACIDDDENLVKYLVKNGAKIDAQDKEGWTPLFAAISCNYLPITNYLISCGARLDVVSFDGELPLDQSTNEGMTSYLLEELTKKNLNPADIRNRERTIMLSEVEKMKRTKDFSNFTNVDNGATMLHVVASKDYIDVLENLLAIISTEMLNLRDNDGWNALHVAAHWNNRRVCVLLVEADIDFDCLTSSNQTVLEVADDEVKPYLREEIRKARFRRDEKASIKRPAQSPNGEYQPSETKIICQEKPAVTIDNQQVNGDKHVTGAEKPITTPIDADEDDDDQTSPPQKTPNEFVQPMINDDARIDDGKLNSNDNDATHHNMEISPSDSQANNVPELPSPTSPTITENTKPIDENSEALINEKNDSKSKVVIPPVKSIESESQRKDKARHLRSTRRCTQGVTAEDIDEAKKLMSSVHKQEKFNMPSQISTILENKSDSCESLPTQNHTDVSVKNDENSGPVEPIEKESQSVITNQSALSDTSDNQITVPQSDSLDSNDRRRRTGSHLVNKRRTRERPPTGTIDIKDIQAAQSEMKKSEETETTSDKPLSRKSIESELDYKVLYENECKEKEKLLRNIARIRKELQESQEQIKNLENNSLQSKNNKLQKSSLQPSDSDSREMEKLREENRKMKEANSALIRVISRLSHPTVSPKSAVGST